MMGKMIKYEFKATWKYMCILFLCVCVISAGILAVISLNSESLTALTDDAGNVLGYVSEAWLFGICGYMFVLMGAIILMICFAIIRFKKALTHEEGYLVHTLPVGMGSIITAKLITFFSYAIPIVGFTLVFFSFILFSGISDLLTGMFNITSSMFTLAQAELWQVGGFTLISSIVSSISSLIVIYASMAIGFSFNGHKGILSLVAYFAIIYVIEMFEGFVQKIAAAMHGGITFGDESLVISLIVGIVAGVVFYFVTYYFMKKRPCVE